jgi:acyl carrier protein
MTGSADYACLVEAVAAVVRATARVPAEVPIGAGTRLVEDLAIDSLDYVGVILQLQDQFDVVIDEDAVPNLCRVADLVAHLAVRTERVVVNDHGCGHCERASDRTLSHARLGGEYRRWNDGGSTSARAS